MIRKLVQDKFFNQEPVLPLRKSPEKKEEPVIIKVTSERKTRRAEKKIEEEDDLFKEMQPSYVAPKRIGATMLAKQEKTKSTRFDMELDHDNSWQVEEI
jgi:hypothetical protein